MARHEKIQHDPTRDDPEIWQLYEAAWEDWKRVRDLGLDHSYGVAEYGARLEVLEVVILIGRKTPEQFVRKGEPPRITMADVIAYHEKLDKKYGSQTGT